MEANWGEAMESEGGCGVERMWAGESKVSGTKVSGSKEGGGKKIKAGVPRDYWLCSYQI